MNNLNQENVNIETSQNKIDCMPDNSRTNSPRQLIVETPITISASPQPSPNSTQHPSSTSHIVNKCSGDSYVSATSPDISSTLFDEDDSYHESSSSVNSSNTINDAVDDSTNNENNVTQSNIDIGESIGTPERECYSPMDKTYSHENESDYSNKKTQESATLNGILTPLTADTPSVQNGNDMLPEFQNNKSLEVSVPKLDFQKIVERKHHDKIMFTSSCKIDRTSFDNFCQFEEFVNNQSQLCEEILSGPLEKTNGMTCSTMLMDKSLDLFDCNNGINPTDTPGTMPKSRDTPLSPHMKKDWVILVL